MRITPDLTIAGYPAIRVRQLFRRVFRHEYWDAEEVATEMQISNRKARALVTALVAEGYLKPVKRDHEQHPGFGMTRRGASLTMASAAKPLRRATADRLVAGVVERCAALADWSAHLYAYRVGELLVFGSYLTDVATLGDVDLAVAWVQRFEDWDVQWPYMQTRIHVANRSFPNISVEYGWPQTETRRFLIGRSGYLSLHDLTDEREFVESIPHRRLWPENTTRLRQDRLGPTIGGRGTPVCAPHLTRSPRMSGCAKGEPHRAVTAGDVRPVFGYSGPLDPRNGGVNRLRPLPSCSSPGCEAGLTAGAGR